MSQNATVNVDIKLGVNKFHVDEGHPHIILAENPDINEFHKLMKACPAGLYKQVTLFSNSGNIPQAPSVLIFATANHASHRPASRA